MWSMTIRPYPRSYPFVLTTRVKHQRKRGLVPAVGMWLRRGLKENKITNVCQGGEASGHMLEDPV